MKVDPKTFFANERTLLHWLSFLVLLQSVGIALMRFASSVTVGIGGFIFVIVSLIFMGYSIFRYEQRRRGKSRIKTKTIEKWPSELNTWLNGIITKNNNNLQTTKKQSIRYFK